MKITNISKTILIVLLFFVSFISCQKEEKGMPTITDVSLRFSDTLQAHEIDSLLASNGGTLSNSVFVDNWIVITGTNLTPTLHVYINDYDVTFNPTLTTDNHIIIKIPNTVPTSTPNYSAPENIRVVTPEGEAAITIKIKAPLPSISSLSNEFAKEGDVLTIFGVSMINVQEILFPGDIPGTNIVESPDGSYVNVKVPGGITESGDIKVVCLAGTATTKKGVKFRDESNIIINFDDKGSFDNWGYTYGLKVISPDSANPPVPVTSGNYLEITNYDGTSWQTIPAPMWWDGNSAIPINFDYSAMTIPPSTSKAKLALKFEMYSLQPWKSGYFNIFFDGSFAPWYRWPAWDEDIGSREPLVNTAWTTVTIPMSNWATIQSFADMNNAGGTGFLGLNNPDPGEGTGVTFNGETLNLVGEPIEKFDLCIDNLRVAIVE